MENNSRREGLNSIDLRDAGGSLARVHRIRDDFSPFGDEETSMVQAKMVAFLPSNPNARFSAR